jgi:hypothetical protein
MELAKTDTNSVAYLAVAAVERVSFSTSLALPKGRVRLFAAKKLIKTKLNN